MRRWLLAVIAFWWLVLVELPLFFQRFPQPVRPLDFAYYYVGAQVGLQFGWQHIYNVGLQHDVFYQSHGSIDFFSWQTFFVSPPYDAWLVVPLAWLPLAGAYWVFTIVSVAALLVTWVLAAPARGVGKLAHLLVGGGLYPVLSAIQAGQVTTLLASSVGAAWWLVKRDRQALAGLVLVLTLLKPQVGAAVPLALLLTGRWRVFATFLIGAELLFAVSVLSLGRAGLGDFRVDLAIENAHLGNQTWTLAAIVGPGVQATAVEWVAGALCLLSAWLNRGAAPSRAIVAGVLASILGTGYHHASDYIPLLPAAWIYLSDGAPRWTWWLFGFGVLACYLASHFGAVPLLAFMLAWLGVLMWEALRPASIPALAPGRVAAAAR
ncbi:MAG TPA: glycosyltransferase family 87 protein [Candidatus Dormibacteraeota bacterium]